jgi:hypothetical protein
MPSAQIHPNPVTQLTEGLLFGDVLGCLTDFRWNPTWKRDGANSVRSRRRVFLRPFLCVSSPTAVYPFTGYSVG